MGYFKIIIIWKIKYYIMIYFVLILFSFILCSCTSSKEIKGVCYFYTGDEDENRLQGPFYIVFYDDNTFNYAESYFTSKIGIGTWSFDEDGNYVISEVINTSIGKKTITNTFSISRRSITWIKDKSDGFIRELEDGATFKFFETLTKPQ